jgi:hypothetical protein
VSGFRDCVTVIFEHIGLAMPPESYLADLERMNEAAAEWHAMQPRGGVLHFEVPDLLEGMLSGVVQTGNLPLAITNGWAANDAAKSFVRFVDMRTGQRGTLLMLQVILLIQHAVQENKANAQGGST